MWVPEIWTHGLISWDKHFTDSAISGATFLGCILRIIMLTCPEKQEQEDTSMQKEDFTSDLGPLTWLQVPCRWGGRKPTSSRHRHPEMSGSSVTLPMALHIPVEARTVLSQTVSMQTKTMGFSGSGWVMSILFTKWGSEFSNLADGAVNSPLSAFWMCKIRCQSLSPPSPSQKPWGDYATSTAVEPTEAML